MKTKTTAASRLRPGISPLLEVCIDSSESAIRAQKGGAQRVELCSNLGEGGVTPSLGTIVLTRKAVSIEMYVMIRPRPGDFLYSNAELQAMKRDIAVSKELGADGVVFGVLKSSGKVDVRHLKELVEAASPLGITFHRAFDLLTDPVGSLRELWQIGIGRVLTSGGRASAYRGRRQIAELAGSAEGKISIMAGAGITPENVGIILESTGVKEIHVGNGVKSRIKSPIDSNLNFGLRSEVDLLKVRQLVAAMRRIPR